MALTPDDQIDAAELALGLVDGQERATRLRRVLAEPEFAAAVEEWRTAFVGLLAACPEVEPPAALERTIAALGAKANPWRWGTGAASLLAASLALALVLRPAAVPPPAPPSPPSTTYAAAMSFADDKKGKPFAALYQPDRGQLRLPLAVDVPHGHSAELWRIGADGVPHSLGVLNGARTVVVPLGEDDRAALARGATLAVSIEPRGGSPTKLPTGPVVATGELKPI